MFVYIGILESDRQIKRPRELAPLDLVLEDILCIEIS